MPAKPLQLQLNLTSDQLYANNASYQKYESKNVQPMGVTFEGYDFPTNANAKARFSYSGGSFTVNNVVTYFAMNDTRKSNTVLYQQSIDFFLKDTKGEITDRKAYEMMMAFFKKLSDKGWQHNLTLTSPRLTPNDSFKYAVNPKGSNLYLDFTYKLTFNEWMQLDSLQRWRLRYQSEVFMDIEYNRKTDPKTGKRHYLITLHIQDQKERIQGYVKNEDRNDWLSAFVKRYSEFPKGRLWNETKAIKLGLKIQQDYQDYTLPLVKEKTGIDTGKFISIDPYKLTYEEYLEQQKSAQSDLTSQSKTRRYRCEAGQKCPKTGYWYTPAHKDMQARYFEEGETMPDIPNVWGQVIWQMQQDS